MNSLKNYRDLGGLRLKNGGRTRYGVFARCENPASLTEEEKAELLAAGFCNVLDLRREDEVEEEPDVLSTSVGFRYFQHRMNDAPYCDCCDVTTPEGSARAYYTYFHTSVQHLRILFRYLCEAQGGVLFHCVQGKDRTGCLAAMLLLLAGAEDAEIVADYHRTYACLYTSGICCDLPGELLVPREENMRLLLQAFHRDYPDVREYFRKLGLSEADMDALVERFTQPEEEA